MDSPRPPDDLDILRSATVLVDARGNKGAIGYAAERIVAMEASGDELGEATWRRILAVILAMQRKGPPSSPLAH